MKISIRFQVAVGFCLSTIVATVASLLIAQDITLHDIQKSFDEALEDSALAIAASVMTDATLEKESSLHVINIQMLEGSASSLELFRLIAPDKHTILEFGKITDSINKDLDSQINFPEILKGRFDTLLSPEGQLRVYSIGLTKPYTNEAYVYVQAAQSRKQINDFQTNLWWKGISIAAMISIVFGAAGFFFIQIRFRPLRNIMKLLMK